MARPNSAAPDHRLLEMNLTSLTMDHTETDIAIVLLFCHHSSCSIDNLDFAAMPVCFDQ